MMLYDALENLRKKCVALAGETRGGPAVGRRAAIRLLCDGAARTVNSENNDLLNAKKLLP
jgi:hypothetical protein